MIRHNPNIFLSNSIKFSNVFGPVCNIVCIVVIFTVMVENKISIDTNLACFIFMKNTCLVSIFEVYTYLYFISKASMYLCTTYIL